MTFKLMTKDEKDPVMANSGRKRFQGEEPTYAKALMWERPWLFGGNESRVAGLEEVLEMKS